MPQSIEQPGAGASGVTGALAADPCTSADIVFRRYTAQS